MAKIDMFPERTAQEIAQIHLAAMGGSRLARRWLRAIAGPTGALPSLTHAQHLAVGTVEAGVMRAVTDLYPLLLHPPRRKATRTGSMRLVMILAWLIMLPIRPILWLLPRILRLADPGASFERTFGRGTAGVRARAAVDQLAASIAPLAEALVARWRELPPLSDGPEWLRPLEDLAQQVADVALVTADGDLFLAVQYLAVLIPFGTPKYGVRRLLTNIGV